MSRPLEVHIEQHWPTRGHRVFILRDGMPHRMLLQPGAAIPTDAPDASWTRISADGNWRWIPITENNRSEPLEPSLTLPEGALEALVAAAAAHVDPEAATVKHLGDAVAMRDRLLAMVEAEWTSRQIERSA